MVFSYPLSTDIPAASAWLRSAARCSAVQSSEVWSAGSAEASSSSWQQPTEPPLLGERRWGEGALAFEWGGLLGIGFLEAVYVWVLKLEGVMGMVFWSNVGRVCFFCWVKLEVSGLGVHSCL